MFDANVFHTPGRTHISMLYGTVHEDADPHHVGKVFCANDAGPHRETVRVRNTRLFPFLEYDSMVCDFPSFPKKNGKSPKEENAAPSLRPENFSGHYPTRNSLPAVAQTSAPADATGEIFSLRAPASVQRGGEAEPMLDLLPIWCGLHFQRECFSYTGAGPHLDAVRDDTCGCGPTSRWKGFLRKQCGTT